MRKLSLVLAGLFASYNCFAELGQISVKTYLDQPLYATIPIYNVASDNYAGLSINLATIDKFKNYGIEYDSELGALQFKVINQGNSHFLQITSSRSIKSPVLNMLLHYQEDNNDFYRQYTVLLNPIQYSAVGYASSSANQSAGRTGAIPIGKSAGGIVNKNSQKTYKKNPVSKYKGKYAQSFNDPFVKAHLAQYNSDDMTFNMNAGDTLYLPARFVQLMYARANFPINQIIMAIGLANYHDLHDQNYVYESGEVINLPEPDKIAAIPTALADQYVWISNSNTEDRIALLSQLAKKYDNSIEINGDPTIFNNNAVRKVSNKLNSSGIVVANASGVIAKSNSSASNASGTSSASGVAKKRHAPIVQPVNYDEPSILDQVFEFKFEIIGGVAVLLGVALVLRRRRKAKPIDGSTPPKKKDKKEKNKLDSSIAYLHEETMQSQETKSINEQVRQNKQDVVQQQEVVIPPVSVQPTVAAPTAPQVSKVAMDVTYSKPVAAAAEPAPVFEFKPTTIQPAVAPEIFTPQVDQILSDTTFGLANNKSVDKSIATNYESDNLVAGSATNQSLEFSAPPIAEPIVTPESSQSLALEVVNDDVINTLEQILSIDQSRNDIRIKLFELYLEHEARLQATKYYNELNGSLDFDDPLRTNLQHIMSKYGFEATSAVTSLTAPDTSLNITQQNHSVTVDIPPTASVVNNLSDDESYITPDNLMDFAKNLSLEDKPVESSDYYSVPSAKHEFNHAEDRNNLTQSYDLDHMPDEHKPLDSISVEHNISSTSTLGGFNHDANFIPTALDKDVVDTLEQILSLDEHRNDIRLKLFEMYSAADMYVPASKYFIELDEILDSDDPLRSAFNNVVAKYGFIEGDSSASSFATADTKSLHDYTAVSSNNFVADNAVDFNSGMSLDNSNSLDFNSQVQVAEVVSSDNFVNENSDDTAPSMTIEQQINLANMYCLIDEKAKAKDILKDIISSSATTFEQKDAAMKIMLENKLNG